MENLPTDILEDILSRLPIEVALHAKQVSKTWESILRNKTGKPGFLFAVKHGFSDQLFYEDDYDHSKVMNCYSDNTLTEIGCSRLVSQSSPKGVMVGSCNGLVCFGKRTVDDVDPFVICNPLTGESVCLPEFNYSELRGRRLAMLASGFGYCPSTNEYKVVAIHPHEEEHKAHVQVYTLGRGDWRYIEFIDYRYKRCAFNLSSGIYANGELYWLHRIDRNVQEGEIVAFDLEHEKFRHIPLPDLGEYIISIRRLKLLGGNNNLYLVQEDRVGFCTDIRAYTMKECNQKHNYVDRSSSYWVEEFNIRSPKMFCRAFAVTRSNEVLMWIEHLISGMELNCYDPDTSTINNLWDSKEEVESIKAIPHMHSVVSLKELGETNVTYLKEESRLRETNVTLKDICQGYSMPKVEEQRSLSLETQEMC